MRSSLLIAFVAGISANGIAARSALAKPPGSSSYAYDQFGARPYHAFRAALKRSMTREEWKSFKAEPLEPHTMRAAWVGEHLPGFVRKDTVRTRVDYLTSPEDRSHYQLTIGENGRLYDATGRRFGTGVHDTPLVMGLDYGLYARELFGKEQMDAFAHSSFFAGQPVIMPADVVVSRGLLRSATNRSGHYRPGRREFAKWLLHIESRGLDMSELDISFDRKSR